MILALLLREFRAQKMFLRLSCLAGMLLMCYLNWSLKKYLFRNPYPLLHEFFLGLLFLMSLLFGFILAILQISSETKSRTESFLLHRPASRASVYGSKFLAGICLYLASLPFVYCLYVLWTSTPHGHIGPFRWEMAYPGLTHVLSGLILYSAALWAASAQKRNRMPAYISVFVALAVAIWYTYAGWPVWGDLLAACAVFLFFCSGLRSYEIREI